MKERDDDNLSLQPPRGMRDFYPSVYEDREALFNIWKAQAKRFGFESYDAPVVESLGLLTRKAGEEIVDQIYTFEDKSGRDLALRPEMTPSLVRLVLAKRNELRFPLKWSSIPQCFRYERTTAGRKREHYQWNIDILGEDRVSAEAEVVTAAVGAIEEVGLSQQEVVVKFGSRKILAELLDLSSIPEVKHQAIFLALDKRGKITDQQIKMLLLDNGITEQENDAVFDILRIKTLDEAQQYMGENSEGMREARKFLRYSEINGILPYLQFDMGVIRGLSYYTGIVFEAFDRAGKYRSIFGGGRYNNLFKKMGGVDIPAVGLGFGDIVIQEVLSLYKKSMPRHGDKLYTVIYSDESVEETAWEIANSLRKQGHDVLSSLRDTRIKQGIKYASEKNSDYVVIVDPREVQDGTYVEKNLRSGEQVIRNLKID